MRQYTWSRGVVEWEIRYRMRPNEGRWGQTFRGAISVHHEAMGTLTNILYAAAENKVRSSSNGTFRPGWFEGEVRAESKDSSSLLSVCCNTHFVAGTNR